MTITTCHYRPLFWCMCGCSAKWSTLIW